MKPAYLEAIAQLKLWVASNTVELARESRSNGTLHTTLETLRFKAQPPSEVQILAIQQLSGKQLPNAYFHWLREVGCGQFFIDEHGAAFDIFNLDELIQSQAHIQQEISEEDEPTTDTFFMIGINNCMGDWMGFGTSRPGPCHYEVFNHEAPIHCYAEDAFWKDFEDWAITAIHSKGQKTL